MRPFGTTIFAEMSALAVRTGSVNLGQGFPDTDGPTAMLDAAAAAIRGGRNQYPPGPGVPELRTAVSAHQKAFWGLDYDPDGEILVTAGATEAIAATILALCEPGDEVVCFEPYYDSYAASIALAGAVRRPVTLRVVDGRYAFDPAELRAAFGPRTRLVLLNSPHNPTGKVFTAEDLAQVAALCAEFGAYAVTDEVYEHLVFTDAAAAHVPLAGLPGMRDRTVQISSAGKTFSCTGWKVGWVCGPRPLVSAVTRVKQFLTYVNAGPLQPAVAVALNSPPSYYEQVRDDLQCKRDRLCEGLTEAGFAVLRPEGTYFVTADITPLGGTDGVEFCLALPERCGVVAVPTQVFYDNVDAGRRLVRFAFCKRDEVLDEAVTRLRRL
ncbi:pyridoxal phosphate-dependent aminotransferase [Dactylosporangium roseum]|uniref:Pyridoxal phosphate-dependent aminotransferase n=2 Tax=Dactylosporangium roseum TaxID=47989 RepID=A0ABY5ZDZ7_9ACTN|nr:pyridoxal phosphate-dependent aminotransferase [Dactylosporangium roseum]UWZ40256.1 pyridoxal phosphate-dependent aminotransferase [Dactylosporangium roseum]